MQQQGITFRQCKNAFLRCSNPERLQPLADSLTAQDLLRCGQKWLAASITAEHWPSTNFTLVVTCMVGNLPDRVSSHIISRRRTSVYSKLTVSEYTGHTSIGILSCVTNCRFAYCRDDPSRSTACRKVVCIAQLAILPEATLASRDLPKEALWLLTLTQKYPAKFAVSLWIYESIFTLMKTVGRSTRSATSTAGLAHPRIGSPANTLRHFLRQQV